MIERRRAQRIPSPSGRLGSLKGVDRTRLLDISPNGAFVEASSPLQPNKTLTFSLPTDGGELMLRAVVRHCRAVRPHSDSHLVFRAGLEFVDVPAEQVELIENTIVDLRLSEYSPG